jgi:hypothetical protein
LNRTNNPLEWIIREIRRRRRVLRAIPPSAITEIGSLKFIGRSPARLARAGDSRLPVSRPPGTAFIKSWSREQRGGRSPGVPLAQLQLIGTGTARAIAHWHYWAVHEDEC